MLFLTHSPVFWLVAALILAILPLLFLAGSKRRAKRLAQWLQPPLATQLTASASPGRRRVRNVLAFFGVACLLLALARPWWGTRQMPVPGRTRDLLFVVDCSRSMLATDVAPNRLEQAKWFIRELVGKQPGDRFGLVAFAGNALLLCPLTQDANTLFQIVQPLDTRTIPAGSTDLQRALTVATDAFQAAEDRNRAIILLSDGEELIGHATATTDKLRELGIPILAVGLGDPTNGSLVQLEGKTLLRDKQGELVKSTLHEESLRELAHATGGLYVHSTTLQPNLDAIRGRVQALVPAEGEINQRERPIERFQIPLLVGLLLLFARFAIGERRAGTVLLLATLLPLLTSATPPPVAKPEVTELNQLQKELARAKPADLPRLRYNLGLRQQQAGNTASATDLYNRVLADPLANIATRAAAAQNLGVLQQQAGRTQLEADPEKAITQFKQAIAQYQEALRQVPGNQGATKNLELAKNDLARAEEALKKKQQKPPEAKPQKQDGDKQGQDQQQNQQSQSPDQQSQKKDEQQLRDQLSKALDKQQQANQAQNPQDKQQRQQDANDATKQAQEQMRRAGNDNDQPKGDKPEKNGATDEKAESRKEAQGALDQAEKAQQEAMRQPAGSESRQQAERAAEQQLKKALKKMGGNPDQPPEKKPDQQPSSQASAGQPQPKPGEGEQKITAQQAGESDQPPPTDSKPSDAILRQMQQQEQNYRDALRQQMQQQQRRLGEPDKDW